jgi:hypothetical protein
MRVIMWHAMLGIARSDGGLWQYLTERTRGRTAIRLEQERNQATTAVIRALPPGGELLEYEPQGRLRIIRRPGRGDGLSGADTMDPALPQPNGDSSKGLAQK